MTRSCGDAARGLEGATKGVREPDQPVFDALKKRCEDDAWPSAAIDCFATMQEGDFGRCASALPEQSREAMFDVIAGNEPSRAGIAVARIRLEQLSVGVPACDRFVASVLTVLACEQMPIAMRVELGNETAQFWSLPTDRLGADDVQRMSDVCDKSQLTLRQQAAGVGC